MINYYCDFTADQPADRLYSSDQEGCLVALCPRCAADGLAAGELEHAAYQPGLVCELCGCE